MAKGQSPSRPPAPIVGTRRPGDSLVRDALAISAITYGEVFEGIYYGHNRRQIERVFRLFLHGVTVLPVTRLVAHRFGVIRGDLRQRGQTTGDPDVLIAATALHHNRTLVTQNKRHFQRISGLSPLATT